MSVITGYYLECDKCFVRSEFIGDGCGSSAGWTIVYRDGEVKETYCPFCGDPKQLGSAQHE